MRILIWSLIVLLILAHQDFWYWQDATLVWGFFPIGLFYHVLVSIVAGILWFLATVFCWPKDLVEEASAETQQTSKGMN